MQNRYHVPVTVEGRTDGLVVSQYHFTSASRAADYAAEVQAKPPYLATVEPCTDPTCRTFDSTAD